jgi:uncharacterized membrane protein YvlD (DUF360 family)
MAYDVSIPIELGLFTLVTAGLIFYFMWLVSYVSTHKLTTRTKLYIALHIAIMVGGLLLTGFANWHQ